MSTRCNVIITKTENGEKKSVNMYRHNDGYPSGVGNDIYNYMHDLENREESVRKEVMSSPYCLAGFLMAKDGGFDELEDGFYMHHDINYVYVIDMDRETVKCVKNPNTYAENEDKMADSSSFVEYEKSVWYSERKDSVNNE